MSQQVDGVLNLFTADTDARNFIGGVPRRKDILAILTNTDNYRVGTLDFKRPRIRLGQVMTNTNGMVIAFMAISVVQKANPTKLEKHSVWKSYCPNKINGIFAIMMITAKKERGKGYGSILFTEVRSLAKNLNLPVFCDTLDSNMGMRKFLENEGGVVERYWYTECGTKMARYQFN